jgi:two-component system sensor histidine kinase RegB
MTAAEPIELHQAAAGGTENLRRLAAMRWLAIAGQIAAIAAARPLLDIELPVVPMLIVVALLAAFNLFTLARLKKPAPLDASELPAQLGVDIAALSVLLFFSGGAANPFVSLYLPPIAVAAAVLPPRLAWAIALLCVAAYSLLAVVNIPLAVPDAGRATRLHLGGMWLIFVVSAVLITWVVARMTAAIRNRDRELAAAREERCATSASLRWAASLREPPTNSARRSPPWR